MLALSQTGLPLPAPCPQIITPELNTLVDTLLRQLKAFQDRAITKDPIKVPVRSKSPHVSKTEAPRPLLSVLASGQDKEEDLSRTPGGGQGRKAQESAFCHRGPQHRVNRQRRQVPFRCFTS